LTSYGTFRKRNSEQLGIILVKIGVSTEEALAAKTSVTFDGKRVCKYDQLAIAGNPELTYLYQYSYETHQIVSD
jgi:hypothetical protein